MTDLWAMARMTTKQGALVERLTEVEGRYRSLLIDALRRCASGRWGLFGHNEHLATTVAAPLTIEELSDLADTIDRIRERVGMEPFELHRRFMASRGRVSANAMGEPRQAKAWLYDLGEI